MPSQHRISAGAIVRHEDRILMVHCVKPNAYDFWVCPGGGVKDTEPLEAAAQREVKEETGLLVAIEQLAYIEEFFNPDTRFIKFWFLGRPLNGTLNTAHPEAISEHIVQAAWRTKGQIAEGTAFPEFLKERFFQDIAGGFNYPVHLPLREMRIW